MRVLRTFSFVCLWEIIFCKYLNIHLIFYFQLTSQKMVRIYWRKYISYNYEGEQEHKNQT